MLMSSRFEIEIVLLSLTLTAFISLPGCLTLEERWEAFDTARRQEIGVKTKTTMSASGASRRSM